MGKTQIPILAAVLMGCYAEAPALGAGESPPLPTASAVEGGGVATHHGATELATLLARPALKGGAVMPPLQGDFEFSSLSDSGMRAKFVLDGTEVDIASNVSEDGLLDVQLEFNGMVLSGWIDARRRVSELDGFATAQGGDTVLTEDDRRVLLALTPHLELASTNDHDDLVTRVVRAWSELPDSIALQRTVAADSKREIVNICPLFNTVQNVWHDHQPFEGNDGGLCGAGNPPPPCTSVTIVGSRSTSLGYSPEDTYYFRNGAWSTSEQPYHVPFLSQFGECYGHCGPGCPLANQVLTRDCMIHDQCMRNGHPSVLDSFCAAEVEAGLDDAIYFGYCPNTAG